MKILVIGSGAREDALVRSFLRETNTAGIPEHEVIAAPGNAGIADLVSCVELDVNDGDAVSEFVLSNNVDLVVVGPEAPLEAGVVDEPRERGIAIFGPSGQAARLESSKIYAKRIMDDAGVPTGRAVRVGNLADANTTLNEYGAPYVVKADGLAAGKGVLVTEDRDAAEAHALFWLQHGSVLIEEFLDGPEVSLFFLSDGHNVVPLAPAQDFKRLLDADEGPNTGGMGAYSPLPWLADRYGSEAAFIDEVTETIALPTVRQMEKENTPFIGLLYCGLILTSKGIRVIEFNARFGDPEAQVILARLKTPLSELLYRASTGTLDGIAAPEFRDDAAVTVVLASKGYPDATETGAVIKNLKKAESLGVDVLHAATRKNDDGDFIADGGRTINIVATGATFTAARELAYQAVDVIEFPGSQHRTDIALKAVDTESPTAS